MIVEGSMSESFWNKLSKPFFVQAPMADVTDCVFRKIIADRGKPDVLMTEFVSADGLAHPAARERLMIDLAYSEGERPVVAQIFSSKPENMKAAAALARELGFDGVDINMGCPVRTINKQLAGAEMIRDPKLAQEVIAAAKEGAGELPVSVKSRIGYSKIDEFEGWMQTLLETKPAAITMHLRTKKELSKVPAHWELAHLMQEFRSDSDTLIIANGDVTGLADAKEKAKQAGLDGVMIGRAIYGNPWLYSGKSKDEISWTERLDTMLEHTKEFERVFIADPKSNDINPYKGFAIMRKFYGAYVAGHPRAKQFKMALMETRSAAEVEDVIKEFGKDVL